METTALEIERDRWWREQRRRKDELTTLSEHLNAATARWLELVWVMREEGDCDGGELPGFLAYRCGITETAAITHSTSAPQSPPARAPQGWLTARPEPCTFGIR